MSDKIKYFDPSDLLYLIALIHTEFQKYVTKVDGKQLSTEDFTTTLKNTLESITRTEEGYGLSQEDFTTELLNKLNNIENVYAAINNPAFTGTPTAPDADGATSSQIATVNYVVHQMAKVVGIRFEKAASYEDLPPVGELGVIYLVPKASATHDVFTEYYWVPPVDPWYEVKGYSNSPVTRVEVATFDALKAGTIDRIDLSGGAYLINNNGTIGVKLPRFSQSSVYELKWTWDPAGSCCIRLTGDEEGHYEIFGDTTVDLSGYVQKTDLIALTEDEIKAAWESKFPKA